MKHTSKKITIHSLWVLILLIALITITGCYYEPEPTDVTIINQTDQVLIIQPYGEIHRIQPGTKITITMFEQDKFPITMKNTQGEIVFDKTFTYEELKNSGFKIIIPPILDNST
jgi:hypothetical protein